MDWKAWTPQLAPRTGFVDVVIWSIARSRPPAVEGAEPRAWRHLLPLLSEGERARAERFVFDRHRVAYVEAHARMWEILAAYAGIDREALELVAEPDGKPRLRRRGSSQGAAPVHFNLSHTDGLCALALSPAEIEVGIDVERVRPIEPALAEAHFSPRECEQLRTLAGREWREAFFRCWTRKEALLKAEGCGLRTPLHSFDVSLLKGEAAQLEAWRPEAKFSRAWYLHGLEPPEPRVHLDQAPSRDHADRVADQAADQNGNEVADQAGEPDAEAGLVGAVAVSADLRLELHRRG